MATDDEAARTARANAIRRARDRFVQKPADAPPASSDSSGEPAGADEGDDPREPNYVAWINKKMREDE